MDFPVEMLNYGPSGILALSMLSVVGILFRSQRTAERNSGQTKGALRLAEEKDEKMHVLVDVIERNTEALAAIKAAVDANALAVRGCPYGKGGA